MPKKILTILSTNLGLCPPNDCTTNTHHLTPCIPLSDPHPWPILQLLAFLGVCNMDKSLWSNFVFKFLLFPTIPPRCERFIAKLCIFFIKRSSQLLKACLLVYQRKSLKERYIRRNVPLNVIYTNSKKYCCTYTSHKRWHFMHIMQQTLADIFLTIYFSVIHIIPKSLQELI